VIVYCGSFGFIVTVAVCVPFGTNEPDFGFMEMLTPLATAARYVWSVEFTNTHNNTAVATVIAP
jgi:hypothetical protein